MRFSFKRLFVISLLFLAMGCEEYSSIDELRRNNRPEDHKRKDNWFVNEEDKVDPYNNLERKDYMDIGQSRREEDFSSRNLSSPGLQDLIEVPEEESLIDDRLVSISVNENVPVKDVLVELGRRAEIDMEIDKDIEGSIIFIAKDKPFSKVIKRISSIAGLRYSFDDGVLKVEKDKPYIASYKFNLLDLTRNSSSSVNSTLSVGGSSGDGGTATVQSGSSSQLDIKSGDGDIWKIVEKGIETILDKYGKTKIKNSPEEDAEEVESALLSSNKNAGLVSVLATERQHQAIKQYLDGVHISLTSQVLIEAKVLEVTLDDAYSSGIDWSLITDGTNSGSFGIGANFGGSALSVSNDSLGLTNGFKFGVLPSEIFGHNNSSVSAAVDLLETFGVTRSLSNPRISTMNNQFAVLNFSQNEVYFDVTLEKEEQDGTQTTGEETTITVESEIKTVPIGVVLTLQPSIDLDRDEITMSVRPTLTRVTNRVSNPGVTIIAQDLGIDTSALNAEIPVVEVRELDTVLRSKSGEIMVIGGLLEERTINTDTGVPGLSRIPYLGNAFKQVEKDTEMVETVIFMKASIIPGQGVSVEDEDFYKKFNQARSQFKE